MHDLPGLRRVAGVLLVSLLSACSGGSGDEDTSSSISTNAVTFSANAPDAAVPAAQTVTATFGTDVAHIAVIHTGDAIASVSSTLSARTAQVTITPATPANIGAGAFTGAVAITGYTCADAPCSRLSAGSTQTVTVAYQISPVVQFASPYVAVANTTNSVTIRGVGFSRFKLDGVRFGTTAATATTLLSDNEILATYPALPAGSYPVQLDSAAHTGAIPTTATLVAVDPTAFTATTLAYPAAPTVVRSLIYDAERNALLVATDAAGGSIARYTFASGAWSTPTSTVFADVRDIELSSNGTQLFALSPTALTPVDPAALTLGTAITAPSLPTDSFLKSLAVDNFNRAVITTGINGTTATVGYVFIPAVSTISQSGLSLNNGTIVGSGSGSGVRLILVQGDPTATADLPVYNFIASSGSFGTTAASIRQNTIEPALDRGSLRVVLNGNKVFNADLVLIGTLPDTTLAVAVRPDGQRAYTLDSAAGGILAFDISAAVTDAGAYTALGAAVPLAGDPGSGIKMTITPDGGTLFLAGATQVVVQPAPAL